MSARYEFKYLITPEDAEQVRAVARAWLEPDPHSDGKYQVTSLYWDADDLKLANQTREGVRKRFKLRVRHYGDEHHNQFTEVKSRVGCSISKTRDPDTFNMLAERIHAKPYLWVRYQREAWVSPWGENVRLTFDTDLEVCPGMDEIPPADGWRYVPLENPVILELKFNEAYPLWMRKMAETLCLKRVSCSKYAQGCDIVEFDGPVSEALWMLG